MDPVYEITYKCMEMLKSDPRVSSFVGANIFDRVPEDQNGNVLVPSPYISLGSTNLTTENFDCIDAVTITIQFHCWSWGIDEAYGSVEVKKLASVVRKCLHNKDINLDNNGLVSLEHLVTAYSRASDGVTNQASLSFEAIIDANDNGDFS